LFAKDIEQMITLRDVEALMTWPVEFARAQRKKPSSRSVFDNPARISDSKSMKWLSVRAALLILVLFCLSCSRKMAPAAPNAPEVLVTTVTPQDVPRVLERVATTGWLHQRQHQRAGTRLHRFARLSGRQLVKKGDLLFQIDPRPFEAALAQAKELWQKTKLTSKADADEKTRDGLVQQKSDQRPGARYSHCSRRLNQSKCGSRRSGDETG